MLEYEAQYYAILEYLNAAYYYVGIPTRSRKKDTHPLPPRGPELAESERTDWRGKSLTKLLISMKPLTTLSISI